MEIRDTLVAAMQANKIVSIHTDQKDQSMCSVGFVDQVNDAWVRLRAFRPKGDDEGYEIRLLSEIFRVDVDGRYEKKIDILRTHFMETFKTIELSSIKEEEDAVLRTLEQARHEKLIVIIRTEDDSDSVIGYVENVSHNVITILNIDDFGQEDGIIAVDPARITSLDCNARLCQVLKYLHRHLDGRLFD